jgi:hypothetical protein
MPTISNTPRPAYIYEAATDQWIPVGFGPHTHAVTDVTNAFNTTTVTTKGDLVVAAGSNNITRLPAGSNGQSLVADSTTTTGLRWQNTFAAGRNVIINGDFNIWQRGTSFSNPGGVYTADRWDLSYDGSGTTRTVSRQAFTPGTAPVAGYEGRFFYRYARSGGTGGTVDYLLRQKIEDVRTLAGQTVTVSFWAKADAARNMGLDFFQVFGTSGSSSVYVGVGTYGLTTSWQRFTTTVTIPSVSGKTINDIDSFLLLSYYVVSTNATWTIDIWGVQLEPGSVANAFETASGTIGGEIALCQRYYYRQTVSTNQPVAPTGGCPTAAIADSVLPFPVQMRSNPSSIEVSSIGFYNWGNGVIYESGAFTFSAATLHSINLRYTHGSNVFTLGQSGALIGRASTSFLGINAEL